jgi:hypothetical protein
MQDPAREFRRTRDELYCGEGRDYYFADKNDYVDSCEKKLGPPGVMY